MKLCQSVDICTAEQGSHLSTVIMAEGDSNRPSMNWNASDLHKEWTRFKMHCGFTFNGPLAGKTEIQKVNYLMTFIGDKGREIYSTFQFAPAQGSVPAEDATLQGVYGKYDAYVAPKRNHLKSSVNFHRRKQGPSETFDNFVTDLKIMVKGCGYTQEERMLRDQIVLGSHHSAVREKCIDKGDELTLDDAISIGQSYEVAQDSLKVISAEDDQAVHLVRRKQSPKPASTQPRQDMVTNCKYCGGTHVRKMVKCLAYGHQCKKCSRLHHFEKCCWPQTNARRPYRGARTHCVEEDDAEVPPEEEFYVYQVGGKKLITEVLINSTPVRAQMDTGSTCNLIPASVYAEVTGDTGLAKLSPHRSLLVMYNQVKEKSLGKCVLSLKSRLQVCPTPTEFVVVGGGDRIPLLSCKTCTELGLITVNVDTCCVVHEDGSSLVAEYPSVFDNGKLSGEFKDVLQFTLDKTVTPVQLPTRKVPLGIRDAVKSELDKLVDNGVIIKMEEPTKWISALLLNKK